MFVMGVITSFYLASTHTINVEPSSSTYCWETHGPIFSIHIGMILSTLGLSPYGFVFELFLQMASYQSDVIHAYIPISLPIPNRYGTLRDSWVHTQ